MAITSFVNYETEIEFEPTMPNSDKKVGIKFWLKSRQCAAAAKISSTQTKDTIKDQILAKSGGRNDIDDDDMADRAADRIIEQSPNIDAACVSKWEMNGLAMYDEDGDKELAFNKVNVRKLFTDPRSNWLASQLSDAITGIEVFTKA